MRKHKDFMSEPDYVYIDIESCFEPIFEPPWKPWKNGTAGRMNPNRHWKTLRSISQSRMASIFLLRQYQDSVSEHFSQAGKTHGHAD